MAAEVMAAPARSPPGAASMIVLEPVSHPELAPIRIDDSLFAIGRNEAPFDAYPPELAGDLSRRHARIFCEHGAVYLADLGSKNGTTVNGAAVRQSITALRSGDLVGFGKRLSYRVQLERAAQPAPRARLASLTLLPEGGGAGLQPIVVSQFPFLVSKADDTFARYRDASATQLNYLSRRHAHLFLKGGALYVEDLGSTNGSFVNGARLDEHARVLQDGDVLAFGGRHFVYRVALQWEPLEADPTLTRIGMVTAAAPVADADRTTFVGAADSFLEIFCVDPGPGQDETPEAAADPDAARESAPAGPAGKLGLMAAGLYKAFGGKHRVEARQLRTWSLAAIVLLVVLVWALRSLGGPEREIEGLLAEGAYAQAATAAGAALARDPGNERLASLGTEAQLKAGVPAWMNALKAGRYRNASEQVEAMRRQAGNNTELAPLLAELDWIVGLKAFVAARGGAQAPVRDPADGATVERVLKQWEEQNEAHQRAFATISAHVPAYRDAYADALSDLRKLSLARGQP
ncbi:FHA domain-containing protein [Massilia sp. DD77]|uniref:FHA domain-containing protein n=1 Tax=Massilia sp. DD77 TaxID=3109349 RepID=UPI002FFDB217